MEKIENKNYDLESAVDLEAKKTKKELKNLENEVTEEEKYLNFDTPENALKSVLAEMEQSILSVTRQVDWKGESKINNEITYQTLWTGYQIIVSRWVLRNKQYNVLEYNGKTNKFYFTKTENGIAEEIDNDLALEKLINLYGFVCALKDKKVAELQIPKIKIKKVKKNTENTII